MGQLRTALANLSRGLPNIPEKIDKLQKSIDTESEKIEGLLKSGQEAWNVLYEYLFARFEKDGTTFADNAGKTMKDVMDANISAFGKEIEVRRRDIITRTKAATNTFQTGIQQVVDSLDHIEVESKKLRAIADKKKAKWLASSSYKSKIKGYLDAIDEIDAFAAKQRKALSHAKIELMSEANINEAMLINSGTTVKDVQGHITGTFKDMLRYYARNKAEADKYVREFREKSNAIGPGMVKIKKWIDEADQMEAAG